MSSSIGKRLCHAFGKPTGAASRLAGASPGLSRTRQPTLAVSGAPVAAAVTLLGARPPRPASRILEGPQPPPAAAAGARPSPTVVTPGLPPRTAWRTGERRSARLCGAFSPCGPPTFASRRRGCGRSPRLRAPARASSCKSKQAVACVRCLTWAESRHRRQESSSMRVVRRRAAPAKMPGAISSATLLQPISKASGECCEAHDQPAE
mmetsp:Transcript_44901/g.97910  ORF Transcript_44901/g.97910 Transcript_44901/m.97910 type:complete len:207 (+) Transcript_44901:946-1566(+)